MLLPIVLALVIATSAGALGWTLGRRVGQKQGIHKVLERMERSMEAVKAVQSDNPDIAGEAERWLLDQGLEPERIEALRAEGGK